MVQYEGIARLLTQYGLLPMPNACKDHQEALWGRLILLHNSVAALLTVRRCATRR